MHVKRYSLVCLTVFSLVGCGLVVGDGPITGGPQLEDSSGPDEVESHGAITLTNESFQQDVLESSQVVMVDCWAPWCGPCVQLSPVIEEIAGEYQGKAVIGKLNIDNAPSLAQSYGVNAIPALLFFRDGELVDSMVGGQPKGNIVAKLNELIGG